jgi:hypothetical protein
MLCIYKSVYVVCVYVSVIGPIQVGGASGIPRLDKQMYFGIMQ